MSVIGLKQLTRLQLPINGQNSGYFEKKDCYILLMSPQDFSKWQ